MESWEGKLNEKKMLPNELVAAAAAAEITRNSYRLVRTLSGEHVCLVLPADFDDRVVGL
jgi:hypothetical protein